MRGCPSGIGPFGVHLHRDATNGILLLGARREGPSSD
jgi:hypothetical protein